MAIDLRVQKKRLHRVLQDAGPRYTSEFNVEVSINDVFDGFGRTFDFYDDLKNRTDKFVSRVESSGIEKVKVLIGDTLFDIFLNETKDLVKIIEKIPNSGGKVELPFVEIEKSAKQIRKNITDAFDVIRKKTEEEEQKNPPQNEKTAYYESELFKDERNYLNRLASEVGDLMYFARGRKATAANKKFLVLRGEAGSGKTHFLCDLAKNRIDKKLPTFIFLGQEFNDNDPWKIILSKIGWAGTKDEFLISLERNAANKSTRAFIVVDAINESKKNVVWSKLVNDTKDYKSICLILSVRTGFEFTALPKTVRKVAVDVIHEGFADREWDALTSFFQFYNLEPDLPLLFPDFTNPLFLKIFCETYRDEGGSVQLRGHYGFTKVFEHYVIKEGKKALTEIGSTNLDAQGLVWRRTIKEIAKYMVIARSDRIPVADAEVIADKVFPGRGTEFLAALEKNWLLLKNPVYSDVAPYAAIGFDYAFPYQKFSDHLIVRYLLQDSPIITDPKTLFGPTGKLNYIFSEMYKFRGLVYALAIQIPERFKSNELILLADKDFKKTTLARDSFLQSLIWRDAEIRNGKLRSFNEKRILDVINKIILKQSNGFEDVMETMLTVAPIPKHPLNAHMLSSYLGKFNLAKRDSIWIPFLNHKYNNTSSVDRLIHWAINTSYQTSYDNESIKLVGISLAWFLSSSDRYLRDSTTKALVILLKNRISILLEILKYFEKNDDLYIQERLLAVSYGCAMASNDPKLYDLGLYVYKKIFDKKKPIPDILIRDYARGCVEAVLRIHPRLSSKINAASLLPPYRSDWPKRFPTLNHLKKKYKNAPTVDNGRYPYGSIWYSLMYNNEGSIADFGNYVLNSTVGYWANKKLLKNGKAPLSDKQLADEFINSLSKKRKELWEKYQDLESSSRSISIFFDLGNGKKERFGPKVNEEDISEIKKAAVIAKKAFEKSLSPENKKAYKKVSKYLNMKNHYKSDDLDMAAIQRWVFQKVIKLGWSPELFYDFDSSLSSNSRSANKAERIGKKYQWIALHEILARIADNFAFKGGWGQEYRLYQGAWSLYRRDIDPSHSIYLTDVPSVKNTWWVNKKYDNWQKSIPPEVWTKKGDASTLLDKFFSTKDSDGKDWLCLNGYFKWREPKRPGKESSFSRDEREVWLMTRAYIVKDSESKYIYDWGKAKGISWGWFPEPTNMYHVHLGEFPYASAYSDQYGNAVAQWHEVKDKEKDGERHEVLETTEKYTNEMSSFDCSVKDSVSVCLPSQYLVKDLELKHNDNPAEFVNSDNEVIAQDPSIKDGGESCLLFRKDAMLRYLKENNYSIIWTVLGEKIVLGMNSHHGILDFSATYLMDKNGKMTGKKHKEIRGANPVAKKKSSKKKK